MTYAENMEQTVKMTEVFAKIVSVEAVQDAANSDKLSLVQVLGWYIISAKNPDGSHRYSPGQPVVFIEVDSLLDAKFIKYFFNNSKIKPDSEDKHRVRSIRIRTNLSQGIIIDPREDELISAYPEIAKCELGDDVAKLLGIKKWEPPVSEGPSGNLIQSSKKHPDLKEYTDLNNYKRFPDVFEEGEEIVVTLKMHGTNHRTGHLRTIPRTFWQKVLKFFKIPLNSQGYVGSRRVLITDNNRYKGFYGDDIYTKSAIKEGIVEKLDLGMVLYCELVGPGIQKNFDYGFKEHKLFAFDLMRDGRYVDYDEFVDFCDSRGITRVPELYRGPYSKELIEQLKNAKDHELDKNVPCREGIVVKPVKETNHPQLGRKATKCISDHYYELKDNTDFH